MFSCHYTNRYALLACCLLFIGGIYGAWGQETAVSVSSSATASLNTSPSPHLQATLAQDSIAPQYRSLKLEDCIRLALEKNLTMQTSRENVKISESSYRLSKAVSAPSVSLSGSNSYSSNEDETDTVELNYSQYFTSGATLSASAGTNRSKSDSSDEEYSSSASIALKQPLLKGLGGTSVDKTAKGQKILDQEIEITRSLQATKRSLIHNITSAYYGLLGAQRNIDIARQAVDEAERVLKVAKVKKEEGMVAKIDVTRSEVQVASKKAALVSAQRSFESSMESFVETLGLPMGTIISLDTTIQYEERDIDLEKETEKAFQNRLDYKEAQLNLERKNIALHIAQRNRLPQLDATLSYSASKEDEDFGKSWKFTEPELTAGLTWSIPLWQDSTELKESYLQAQSAKKIYEITLEDTRRNIILEVRQAVISVEEARENLDILRESIKQAEESLRLAKRSYEEGLQTYLDVLDSQNSYTSTQNSYTSALTSYLVALSNLDKITASHPLLKEKAE